MGKGLGGYLIAYLDTNVVLYLAEGRSHLISLTGNRMLREANLLISPMVLIELEYLYEKGRTRLRSRDVQTKFEHESAAQICAIPFATVARNALEENWTRDCFDRIIVANAKANGLAFLISADAEIAKHYPRTVW